MSPTTPTMTKCHSSLCPYRLFSDFISLEDRLDSKHSPIDSVIIVDRLIQMLSSSRTYSVTQKKLTEAMLQTFFFFFKWCTIYAGGTKRATAMCRSRDFNTAANRIDLFRMIKRPIRNEPLRQSMEMGWILHTNRAIVTGSMPCSKI